MTSRSDPVEHVLKCWTEFYGAIERGEKTFELRCEDDRHFKVGDTLYLCRFDPERGQCTGEVMRRRVTYLTRDPSFGIAPGWVCMAIAPVPVP